MTGRHRPRRFQRWLGAVVVGMASAAVILALAVACTTNITPTTGPQPGTAAGVGGNSRPTVVVSAPAKNLLVTEDEQVTVTWSVNDTPGETVITGLKLVNILTNQTVVNLVVNVPLITTGTPIPQTTTFSAAGLAGKTYLVVATASDGVNPVQEDAAPGTVQVIPAGTRPANAAPSVTLLAPAFDLSVAEGDTVTLNWIDQDVDDAALVTLLLDLDQDPRNDNPFDPDDPGIVVVGQAIEDADPIVDDQGNVTNPNADTLEFKVDVTKIPPREGGLPYYPRATITDGKNPAVSSYSPGKLFVTALAESPISPVLGMPEPVDLGLVGLSVTGATFLGFNPGAYCGSTARTAGDFDADGADDFVLVARYGRPFGYETDVARGVPQGSTGEAYLLYGSPSRLDLAGEQVPGTRFGGRPNANSTSTALPGVILAAPPPDGFQGDDAGITDFTPVADQPFLELSGGAVVGDGRPELLFGFAHHNGVVQGRDDDPGDSAEQVEFILDAADSITPSGSGDSYTSQGDPSGEAACFRSLLIVDSDADDRTNDPGPFTAYFTFTPTASELVRMRSLLLTPGAEATATLVLFINEPGDDMNLFGVNLQVLIDPCAIPAQGIDPTDLIEVGDVSGADIGEVETSADDFIGARILSGAESFSFVLFADPTSAEGDHFDTVRIQSAENFNSPRLEIQITQQEESLGCYPDPFPNNLSNSEPSDDPVFGSLFGPAVPWILEDLGFVVMCQSENRDCDGTVDQQRWTRDAVRLDHFGQEPAVFTCGASTLRGARWQSTLYDAVDHLSLFQPPVEDSFGQTVDSMPDLNNDQIGELVFSAPTLELDQANLISAYGMSGGLPVSTHAACRAVAMGYRGSVFIQLGGDFNDDALKETASDEGNSSFPNLPNHDIAPTPQCGADPAARLLLRPGGLVQIFAESINDRLGGARYAGDFNQDGSPDIVMGAPLADPPGTSDGGKVYLLYGRVPVGDIRLIQANDPGQRPPMLRVFGETSGDQVGLVQGLMQDFNDDGLDDVLIASKRINFAGGNDNGAVGVIFGGQEINGDRDFSEIGTSRLPGVIFYGDDDNDWAGADAAGSGFYDTQRNPVTQNFSGLAIGGDFNGDGVGDLAIAAPGEIRTLPTGQQRQGVVYLIFGNRDLFDATPGGASWFPLSLVGTSDLPGIVFIGPYEPGTLDADGSINPLEDIDGAPNHVGWLGDINGDGFDELAIGNTRADYVDPDAPDQRRPDAGECYVIYGNNVGRNDPANW